MKKEKKTENKKIFGAVEAMLALAIIGVMIVSVNCYIKKYEMNYKGEVLQSELKAAQNEGELLKVEYQKRADYKTIEDYAVNTLGMTKINSIQVVYVDKTHDDSMNVVSSDEGLGNKLSKTFSIVWEYFKG